MRSSIVAVGLLCLTVYFSNGRAHPEVDCVAAPYEAWALVRYGSLDLSGYPQLQNLVGSNILPLADGTHLSRRPPGTALTSLPLVTPLALFREQPLAGSAMIFLGKIVGAIAVACASMLFFAVCRRVAPEAAWAATFLLGLGTCLCSVASQALWMHGPSTLWICVALYALMRDDASRASWNCLAGLALGLAVLCRPTTVFFPLATLCAFLLGRRWRELGWLSLGGALPLAFLLSFNCHYFGSPFLGGYAEFACSQKPPLWLGLGGLLIAPSRGVLIYSPALLLVPIGVVALLRQAPQQGQLRTLLLAWLGAAAVTLLFYAHWFEWRGGWCFGPRFLCETMPATCLVFALGYQKCLGWRKPLANGLVALSVLIHLAGIHGYKEYAAWHQRHEQHDGGRCLFSFFDTQIEAHLRAMLWKLTHPFYRSSPKSYTKVGMESRLEVD